MRYAARKVFILYVCMFGYVLAYPNIQTARFPDSKKKKYSPYKLLQTVVHNHGHRAQNIFIASASVWCFSTVVSSLIKKNSRVFVMSKVISYGSGIASICALEFLYWVQQSRRMLR